MRIDAYFPYRLVHLARAVDESMTSLHATRFGLCPDEWRVLSAAAEVDPAPTRDIAELAGLDKVAISRAASKLEERGLIRRHEAREDRRIKIIHLTPAGKKVVEDAEAIVREREAWLLEGLTPQERALVSGMIDKLTERADALCNAALRSRPHLEEAREFEPLAGVARGFDRAMAI